MRYLLACLRNRIDLLIADYRRWRAGTHLLEEMGRHPERIADLPDPAQQMEYDAIADDLLADEELVEAIVRTGWIR
ncbi:hypothetical protein [Actinoallomurus sp. CA-142502]|uniref:hypothetical protein n=1 Tax=Actinoallomurus sp. CA-142502 TaxID=3239885 RepID=UPI003D89C319